MLVRCFVLALASASAASAAVVKVSVGKGGLAYSPSEIMAAAGDVIEFKFVGGTHDAAAGDWDNLCQPAPEGTTGIFASGVTQGSPTNDNVFKVTVNSTDPTLVYCSVGLHCAGGMVAVINPTAERTVAAAKSAARSRPGKTPTGVFGGVFGPASP